MVEVEVRSRSRREKSGTISRAACNSESGAGIVRSGGYLI